MRGGCCTDFTYESSDSTKGLSLAGNREVAQDQRQVLSIVCFDSELDRNIDPWIGIVLDGEGSEVVTPDQIS